MFLFFFRSRHVALAWTFIIIYKKRITLAQAIGGGYTQFVCLKEGRKEGREEGRKEGRKEGGRG